METSQEKKEEEKEEEMRFYIRIKESLTLEHVYEFEISNSIDCKSYWQSRRSGEGDIWGFDWNEYFASAEAAEHKKAEDKYGEDEYYDVYYWNNPEASDEYNRIHSKYNPIMNNTKDGLPYLTGTCSHGILEKYPPPMDREEFEDSVKFEAKSCITKMKIR